MKTDTLYRLCKLIKDTHRCFAIGGMHYEIRRTELNEGFPECTTPEQLDFLICQLKQAGIVIKTEGNLIHIDSAKAVPIKQKRYYDKKTNTMRPLDF